MNITSDHDKGQGFSELEMTRESVICDGCNVRAPFEHRCHGSRAYVRGERTGRACECRDCLEPPAEVREAWEAIATSATSRVPRRSSED